MYTYTIYYTIDGKVSGDHTTSLEWPVPIQKGHKLLLKSFAHRAWEVVDIFHVPNLKEKSDSHTSLVISVADEPDAINIL